MTERIGGCNYMKRYGHLYEKIYDMENLKLAHQHAKKGKGWYAEVQMIDSDPDKYLKELQDMLMNKTYHTSEYEVLIPYATKYYELNVKKGGKVA